MMATNPRLRYVDVPRPTDPRYSTPDLMLQTYDPVGAAGGTFAPALIRGDPTSEAAVKAWEAAHLKRPPALDPWFTAPTPQDPVSKQRDAIANAMVSNGVVYPGGVGGPSGTGFTGLGQDPDNPTSPPAQQQAPTPQAPVKGEEEAPPDEGVEQGPANPSGTVTSAPIGPVSNATPTGQLPSSVDPNNPEGIPFGPPSPTVADPDTGKTATQDDEDQAATNPNAPPAKGEPTAAEDAAALAAANQQAVQEGFMNPDGTPGKGVTTAATSANLALAPTISNVTTVNPDTGKSVNMSFAPPQGPPGLQTVAPPEAPQAPQAPGQMTAAEMQAAIATALAQAAIADPTSPEMSTVSTAPGPTSVAPSVSSLGLNAPTGVPGVNTGLQHGYFGDPAQTSTQATVNAQPAVSPVSQQAALSMALAEAINAQQAQQQAMTDVGAQVGTAPSAQASTPGMSAAEAAQVGTAPSNAAGYGYGPTSDQSPSAQEAAALGAQVGISPAEAAAAIAAAQDSVNAVAAAPPGPEGPTGDEAGAPGPGPGEGDND